MDKRALATRAVQIVPATGWYARIRVVEHDESDPDRAPSHLVREAEVPVICWALAVDGAVSGRVEFHDGCIGDPARNAEFVGYAYLPDGVD